MDIQFDVKFRSLAIECFYPSEQDLNLLSTVWLTNDNTLCDPSTLDFNEDLIVTLCYNGSSSSVVTSDFTSQEYEGINCFDTYAI